MTSFTYDAVLAHDTAEWASSDRSFPAVGNAPESEAWALLEASGELAMRVDFSGRILLATEATAHLLAYPREYLLCTSLQDLVALDHRDRVGALLRAAGRGERSQREQIRFSGVVGGSRWIDLRISRHARGAEPDHQGENRPADEHDDTHDGARHDTPGSLLVFGTDISHWIENEQHLIEQSFRDPLTGLGNRAFIRKRITEYLARDQFDGAQFAVALMDLDGFKRVNDSLGHEFGDALLKEVSVRLQNAMGTENMVGRLGGDEFVLLLDHLANDEAANAVLERIVQTCRQPLRIPGYQVRVTTSIGLAFAGTSHQSASQLLKHADLAMYEAKAQGKNRYSIYTPELAHRLDEQFRIEQGMFEAVQNGEFLLNYQPIVWPATGEVCAVEALMRWEHRDGMIAPDVFIPVAENNGLINHLGAWALRSACAQLASWDAQGIHVGYMSVNVSPVQFRHPGFVESVCDAIQDAGISAHRLVLEITEGVLMTDPKSTEAVLLELRGLGIRFAVDDFGTGYSSLSYLRRFPLSALKIDRSFVADMATSPHARTIVSAVLSLSRELGMVAIAEGVETEEQSELLAAQGCDLAQGWRYSKALSPIRFEEAIQDGKLSIGPAGMFSA
jgi:diguanylate cyclase (GGDEF)-like protein